MKLLIILLPVITVGCATTPNLWSPEKHKEMLSECRATCGDGRLLSYDSMSGQCKCYPYMGKEPLELLLEKKAGK